MRVNMRINALFVISLLGMGLVPSCDKNEGNESKELGIEGRWRLESVEGLFKSEAVATASTLSGFSSLVITSNSVTVNNTSFPYTFGNGVLLINGNSKNEEWRVKVLNESDLVLEVPVQRVEPNVLQYVETMLQEELATGMIDKETYDTLIGKISVGYLGERIFMVDPIDGSGVYYYYYDSSGKRVPCDLVGGEAFVTSYRITFKRQ